MTASEPFPDENCGDCGDWLTWHNRWQVPPLTWYVCERCGRDRLAIRARLRLEQTDPKLYVVDRLDTSASL